MDIQLITIGLTNQDQSTLPEFKATILEIIEESVIPTIFVLPEYCWGELDAPTIITTIESIREHLHDNQYMLFGSFPRDNGKGKYNTAVLADREGIITQVQKTRVLADEAKKNQVENGTNSEVVDLGSFRVAIIICADIWDQQLLNRLLREQGADILLIPAFTVVPPGHSSYARSQWHALAVVRSREYLVPIAIADHSEGTEEYSVGNATCIADPSRKSAEMQSIEDFLELPTGKVARLKIDLTKVQNYREYRINKGLFSEEIIK